MSNVFYNANNLVINNGFVKNPYRYYLEEWFKQRPAIGASSVSVLNTTFPDEDARTVNNNAIRLAEKLANRDFEVMGTNMTTELCIFNTSDPGIVIQTNTVHQDQAIIAPHLEPNQSSWTSTKWNPEKQLEWECAIHLPSITGIKIWAGLKQTFDQLLTEDDHQLFFKFQTDSVNSEVFKDFTKLHFIHSISGVHYVSELPITIDVDTVYNLRITIDSNKLARIFVNGIQYNITHDIGSSPYGSTVINGDIPSTELSGLNLIPYIGIENGNSLGTSKLLNVYYQKMSRSLT
jgi:hypothetical protein